MEQSKQMARPAGRLPRWLSSVRQIGPGLVAAMTLLGAGELIDVTVAGANYGYALMWGFVLVLLSKFFFMFMMTKYQLFNGQGLTIMQGFGKLGKIFPLATGIGLLLGIFAYGAFYVPAAGTALVELVGFESPYAIFIGSLVSVALAAFMLKAKRAYAIFENFSRFVVLLLVGTFVYTAISQGPSLLALVEGLLFSVPSDKGIFGSLFVVVALIGVAGVTPAAIVYNYAIYEKGWRSPQHRATQVLDLLVAIVAIAIIDFSIWIVAAETVHGSGSDISDTDDLARLMQLAIGDIGPPLLWVAIFFASFTSVIGTIFLFSRAIVDALRNALPSRYEDTDMEKSPIINWLTILGLLLPLLCATPWAPNMVVLAIVAVTIPLVATPFMLIGLIRLTGSVRFLPAEYVRRWQSGLLAIMTVAALVSLVIAGHGLVGVVRTLTG
ncbi:Nramp family divalent metal transporter [Mycolicibacterium frederiksbergense]|uniref:Nramp family divalent metal transporter n=1 Tax=Mycolicibacterium frederiksbergense TaxID=117567 RepID=UPI00399A9A5B